MGSIWGPFGGPNGGPRATSTEDPFWTSFSPPWEGSWAPSWAPSWPHVGGLGASWGALGRSWRDLGSIGDRFLTILEQHAKTRGFKTAGCSKNLQKHNVFQWFFKVPGGQHEASWGGFWRRLGASWALLEPSWAPWARLESVLGASWGHLDRHMKKTLKTSSKNEPTRPKIETCSTYEREALRKEDKQQACEPIERNCNEEYHASNLKTNEHVESKCASILRHWFARRPLRGRRAHFGV